MADDGKTPLMHGEEPGPTAPPPAYDDAVSAPPPPLSPPNMAPQQNQHVAQYAQPGSTVYYGTIPQIHMQCTNCGQQIITNLTYVTGMTTWLACIAICAFGGFLGCCFIPFCLDGLKDVRHTCPGCGAHLGTFRKI